MKIKFTPDFNTALGIAEKYSLNTKDITKALDEMLDFRVTAPVIGGFSTGKSSLINAVLGDRLLSTNITPETAVPTEITGGSDTVTLVTADGSETSLALTEFDPGVLSAEKYTLVKIATSNEFFAQIPTIKLVDMPGFDSGIEVHNKAIDNYLPQSLAYILTVASDEGTLRASIINFLNELKLYDMPVYTVITKAAKTDPETLEQLRAHISETMRRFLKIENPKIAVTTAKGDVDVEEFREFLLELQSSSDDIYNKYFGGKLDRSCSIIEKYLTECLDKDDMTLEELKLQKEQAERAFEEVGRKFAEEKQRFRGQVDGCVSSIKSKISANLSAASSSIENYIMHGNEGAVRDKINSIIRNAYTIGIQTELEPRIKRYIANVESTIQVDIYDAKAEIPEGDLRTDNEIKGALNSAAQAIAPAIGAWLGTVIIPIPGIGTLIGAAIGAIVNIFINSGMNAKQKAQKEQLVREKAKEIISSAVSEGGDKIATAIYQYVDKVDEGLAAEIEKERELKAKILADCEDKLRAGEDERKRKTAELKADLETIRSIANGIR